jgi:hypothetical protein
MKTPRISRRQFFKLSAFGAGTVAAASLARSPLRRWHR